MRRILLLFIIVSFTSYEQNIENTTQCWWDFNDSYTFDKQWKVYSDAGYRIILGDDALHRFFVRPSGSLQLNDVFTLHGGLGFFTTLNDMKIVKEVRPFQGLAIHWPDFPVVPLTHYLRFEQRFFSDSESSYLNIRGR